MPRIHRRDAVAAPLAADPAVGDSEGFTLVEIIVGLLIVGIFAAIVVFSVATVTRHSTTTTTSTTPAQRATMKCDDEVAEVRLQIRAYKLVYHKNPASLAVLVPKPHAAVPTATSLSRDAGFEYNPHTGAYAGGSCVAP